jgi:UDP-glucose 4-epimerase
VKKVCVIGGGGFLGSHVCDQLTHSGYQVTIFDKKESAWKKPNQTMIVADLLDQQVLESAIEGCEAVYNFAAIADLDDALNRPMDAAKVNILGNIQALEACRKYKIKRFVYASTVYVHSREGGFYRCSKHAAEQFVEEYQVRYGLDFTILRYGSLYGPRSDHHNSLWRIINNALDVNRVCYEGSPEAMREYIHVVDAARASVAILQNDFKNEHIVLTGQEPMRVADLLKMLAEILGIPQTVEFIDSDYAGHYIRTPYAYQTRLGRKYVPSLHIDLGQGLLELIGEIKASAKINIDNN